MLYLLLIVLTLLFSPATEAQQNQVTIENEPSVTIIADDDGVEDFRKNYA